MRLSIVIPMYNAAASIEKCLVSTQQQDIPSTDYEVIVINDGSTDDSSLVAKEVAAKYENILIYSQENGGLSVARNAGLDKAKGDYIMFLDSDDWISRNCLKKIVTTCELQDLDLLGICAAKVIDGKTKRCFSLQEGIIKRGAEYLRNDFSVCAPFTIYRSSFLNRHRLRFYPGIYHEDNEFTPRVYYLAERVAAINDLVYYYVIQAKDSITQSVNVKKPLDVTIVMQNLDDFYHKYVKYSDRKHFHYQIARCMNSALYQTLDFNKEDCKKVNDAFYSIKHLFFHVRQSSSLKYNFVGWLYTLFPHHVVEVYKAFHFRHL